MKRLGSTILLLFVLSPSDAQIDKLRGMMVCKDSYDIESSDSCDRVQSVFLNFSELRCLERVEVLCVEYGVDPPQEALHLSNLKALNFMHFPSFNDNITWGNGLEVFNCHGCVPQFSAHQKVLKGLVVRHFTKNMEQFVNPKLLYLSVSNYGNSKSDGDIFKFPQITHLDLFSRGKVDLGPDYSAFSKLETLTVNLRISQENIDVINQYLPSLKSLQINGKVKKRHIKILEKLEGPEELVLIWSISNEDLDKLQRSLPNMIVRRRRGNVPN